MAPRNSHFTIDDIAKRAGVSIATVSRVINQAPHVTERTARKVQKAIKELNYQPSAYARSLSLKQSNIIGVIVPEIVNPFFIEIITGIKQEADENGLDVFFFSTDEDIRKEERSIQILQQYRVRGIIITPVTDISNDNKDYIKTFENLNIPIVLMDRRINGCNFDGVYFDDHAALYQATKLLIDNGHRDIVMITGEPKHEISQIRVSGFKDAFKDHKIPLNKKNLIRSKFDIESGYNITKKLIAEDKLPTAFIGISNLLSMGILKALFEYGVQIPKEVAFVGYDRLEFFNILNINLTLVEKNAAEMGRRAARLMIDHLTGVPVSSSITLMPELVVRGSEVFPKAHHAG